jgi:beta-alanine degradation protein BauB
VKQAESAVLIDSDRVRGTAWKFAPGQATGVHRHEFDYVVVPVSGGTFTVTAAGGTTQMNQQAGQAYIRQSGVEHDVANSGQEEALFVEVELKT